MTDDQNTGSDSDHAAAALRNLKDAPRQEQKAAVRAQADKDSERRSDPSTAHSRAQLARLAGEELMLNEQVAGIDERMRSNRSNKESLLSVVQFLDLEYEGMEAERRDLERSASGVTAAIGKLQQ